MLQCPKVKSSVTSTAEGDVVVDVKDLSSFACYYPGTTFEKDDVGVVTH
jgi:hypothetical protein